VIDKVIKNKLIPVLTNNRQYGLTAGLSMEQKNEQGIINTRCSKKL